MIIWTGKAVGAVLGYLIGGPIGALIGLIIGQYFDVARATTTRPLGKSSAHHAHSQAQQAFFEATFSVMGHIAKADGRITETEIQAARKIMQNMMLSDKMKKQAIKFFTYGKSPGFRVDDAINTLLRYCGRQPNLLRMFLEIQFQAAISGGYVGPNKRGILEFLCLRLGFHITEFAYFSNQQHQRSREKQRSDKRYTRSDTSLDDAYKLLGIPKNANNNEVKRAYRKQMSQNHPDKLVSKGLPEEMIKMATEKTQKIKSAYERICAQRGMN